MSDLFGNHIVGFPTRRLICSPINSLPAPNSLQATPSSSIDDNDNSNTMKTNLIHLSTGFMQAIKWLFDCLCRTELLRMALFTDSWAQNYNPPLKLRKTLVKVKNFSIQKIHLKRSEI